jgi:hypothetical protein
MEYLKESSISLQDYCDLCNLSEKQARDRIHKGEVLARKIKGQYRVFNIPEDDRSYWERFGDTVGMMVYEWNVMFPKNSLFECHKMRREVAERHGEEFKPLIVEDTLDMFLTDEIPTRHRERLLKEGYLSQDYLEIFFDILCIINEYQIFNVKSKSNKDKAKQVLEVFDGILKVMNQQRDKLEKQTK